jgi:hypothetical protein
MKFSISKLFLTGVSACTLGIVLCMGATPVNADIYPGLNSVVCMADAWENVTLKNLPHDKINCSANDVEITTVIPLDEAGLRPGEPGYKPVECIQGQVFQLNADITVRTNANKRYDTTFYLPLTNQSPQYIQIDQRLDPPAPQYPNYCSMMLPIPDDEGPPDQVADVDIDSDGCGDISKAFSTDEYTLYNEMKPLTWYVGPVLMIPPGQNLPTVRPGPLLMRSTVMKISPTPGRSPVKSQNVTAPASHSMCLSDRSHLISLKR